MSRSANAKGKRRFHAKFAHARFIVIPYQTCNRYDLGMQIINICRGMSCPSRQWHRTGYRRSPVRTLPAAPLWCDLGLWSRTVVVIKLRRTSALSSSSLLFLLLLLLLLLLLVSLHLAVSGVDGLALADKAY